MNIFTIFFFKILARYSPKLRHQIAPFKKIISGEHMPPNPLANTWLRHALHGASRHVRKALTFPKIFLPPPRNEILDTPLRVIKGGRRGGRQREIYLGMQRGGPSRERMGKEGRKVREKEI